jgi:hypothetical protein
VLVAVGGSDVEVDEDFGGAFRTSGLMSDLRRERRGGAGVMPVAPSL